MNQQCNSFNHPWQYYHALAFNNSPVRQCEKCHQFEAMIGDCWIQTTIIDQVGGNIYIITADQSSFDEAARYLAADYKVPIETFIPLLSEVDWYAFCDRCSRGWRPCIILLPANWFMNPYVEDFEFASALSSNVGGLLLQPLTETFHESNH